MLKFGYLNPAVGLNPVEDNFFALLVSQSRRLVGLPQASALVVFKPEARKRLIINTLARKRQKHHN